MLCQTGTDVHYQLIACHDTNLHIFAYILTTKKSLLTFRSKGEEEVRVRETRELSGDGKVHFKGNYEPLYKTLAVHVGPDR